MREMPAVILAVIVAISVFAYMLLPEADTLPMQWSAEGTVNWSAPRLWALAFTPVLAAVLVWIFQRVETGGNIALWVAVSMLGAHCFHLWLIFDHLSG